MAENLYKRRDFLGNVLKAGAAGILINPSMGNFYSPAPLTVSQVIERILTELPVPRLTDTVDTLKSGSGDMIVTGIVTTMFATVKVIRAAAKIHANFIIAHEPTFYNHLDDKNWVENNEVVKEKMKLLEKHNITVWRFHDYWHRMKPDGILHGILLKTGWLAYNEKEENIFDLPVQSVGKIVSQLKQTMHLPNMRMISDMNDTCSRIALLPGAGGGQNQIRTLITSGADLLIVGEASEWETPEYVRDARALGKKISLIVLGHINSEEPGMEWLAAWLQPKLPGMPVNHIASENIYTWVY